MTFYSTPTDAVWVHPSGDAFIIEGECGHTEFEMYAVYVLAPTKQFVLWSEHYKRIDAINAFIDDPVLREWEKQRQR